MQYKQFFIIINLFVVIFAQSEDQIPQQQKDKIPIQTEEELLKELNQQENLSVGGEYVVEGTSDDEEDRNSLMKDWEEHMMDFVPDDMITFTIEKGATEILEEEIGKATKVRGAFFLPMFSKSKLDFVMKDPQDKIVTYKGSRREAVFSVNVTLEGTYKFIFSNERGSEAMQITFALDVHNATQEHLQYQNLNAVEQKVQFLHDGVNDLYYESKFSQMRQESGYLTLQDAHNKLLTFTLIETMAIIAITVWQVYYIKKILDSKRLI